MQCAKTVYNKTEIRYNIVKMFIIKKFDHKNLIKTFLLKFFNILNYFQVKFYI